MTDDHGGNTLSGAVETELSWSELRKDWKGESENHGCCQLFFKLFFYFCFSKILT